ncbi:MAG: TrkH family potassium uptake protein [Alphaproteobacteria bacterium]
MISYQSVFFILGILLTTLGMMMCIPMVVDLFLQSPDWLVFMASAGVSIFVGVALILTMRSERITFRAREAFILTTASWLLIALFGALPFMFSELRMSVADAFFESMSGITTTGATVITTLTNAPPGILIWRALLQWLGGIGFIVMAIAVLPLLRVGGMQLFQTESSDQSEKIMPRATQIAGGTVALYVGFSCICALLYWAAGMSGFDAIAHAMTTIATGGFSTSDESIRFFDNTAIDVVAITFMLIGSLPFALYLQAIRGRPLILWHDSQVRWFLTFLVATITIITAWLYLTGQYGFSNSVRYSAFNVISIVTTTGYASANYDTWGAFAVGAFFFLMVVGGCSGSTTCGIKIFRFQVIYETARVQISRLLSPHGVFVPRFNGKALPEGVSESVMSFFFVFALSFSVLALGLGFVGLDFVTAMSAAASAIACVGPGLGHIVGPAGTFAPLPDAAKYMLAAGMLLGRLELFTVLVLFAPAFWRK